MATALTITIVCLAAATVLWWTIRPARPRGPRVLDSGEISLYRMRHVRPERHLGIVTGDLRRVHCAQLWVNPENTAMRMSRVDELSVSAIIRYEGACRDTAGRITADVIADELERRVGPRRPVPAGTAIITGPGDLARFGVRYVAHSAAVQGEPGGGYRQIRDVGRCATAVLTAIDGVTDPTPVRSVLFPLLGAGQGGGDPADTARALVGAVVDYFTATPASAITAVYLLAYTDIDLAACRKACDRAALRPSSPGEESRSGEPAREVAMTAPPFRQARKTLRIGLTVDVVGFGGRSTTGRESLEHRIPALLRRTLADAGADLGQVDHQWHGDGASIYLPGDADPSRMLTELIEATARRLAEDNRHHEDRIRLRMAVTLGLLGHSGTTGYTGPLVVDLARMVDAPPLRQAIADEPDRDLAVLTSDHVYSAVVRPGGFELAAARFRRVEVVVKEFAASAWLWVPEQG
ncbi:macro domain-containing protein [Amycolatopsis umgeniensis]|uniref:O-acetyl-ADP-ribose deacetylase (Regulator of RNase III) n=1 Tax=Amycolatopsis umgeniensis TaxID=336628 RepID=A0A841B9H2_9PSEU|nr:macro domain-containing protein [Amycolatopsis umgeniensis]MBB5857539.1 O-acetyl-ADP-ribose deacetylase (regulator of RNase III) [Amycolatopsis umgeniensis]